jgi:hypothetical protein
VAQAVAEKLSSETEGLSPEEVDALSWRLVSAFYSGLDEGNPFRFHVALEEAIQTMEAAGDHVYALELAIRVLRAKTVLPKKAGRAEAGELQVERTLSDARAILGQAMQRQYLLRHVQQGNICWSITM